MDVGEEQECLYKALVSFVFLLLPAARSVILYKTSV